MKLAGLIAEYNPLHHGHRQQLQEIRHRLGANTGIIVVLSGSVVQRGEPALLPPSVRAQLAIQAGADLVLELPYAFSCAAAGPFAQGAVKLLGALGLNLTLCFGLETPDYAPLHEAAAYLVEEAQHPAFKLLLQQELRAGQGFAAARARALAHGLADKVKAPRLPDGAGGWRVFDENQAAWEAVLRQPNVILGVEYLCARLQQGLKRQMSLLTLPRWGQVEMGCDLPLPLAASARARIQPAQGLARNCNGAGSSTDPLDLSAVSPAPLAYPSASQIRAWVNACPTPADLLIHLSEVVWPQTLAQLVLARRRHGAQFADPNRLWPLQLAALQAHRLDTLQAIEGMGEALARRLMRGVHADPQRAASREAFLTWACHRGVTRSRLNRTLYHLISGYTAQDAARDAQIGPAYLKPLAYSRQGRSILKWARRTASLPWINTVSDFLAFPSDHPARIQGLQELDQARLLAVVEGRSVADLYSEHARLYKSV